MKVIRSRGRKVTGIIIIAMIFCLAGCDAFVRKFTRKQNKESLPQEEMVLAPEEYQPPVISKEDAYRQYFLYWKSWHDELVDSLARNSSQKKQLSCLSEELKNLDEIRKLLKDAQQKALDIYIDKIKILRGQIQEDIYGMGISRHRATAENIRRGLMRDFSYQKVKNELR